MKNRVIAFSLALLMVFSCLPLAAFAAGEEDELVRQEEVQPQQEEPDDAPDTAEEPDALAEEQELPEAKPDAPNEEAEILTEETVIEGYALEAEQDDNILTEENFPDPALLRRLREMYSGNLKSTAAKSTYKMKLDCGPFDDPITDLTGLSEFFPKINYLYIRGNALTELDLSGLTNISELYCDDNLLTELDVTPCSTRLKTLSCTNNRITEIKVSSSNVIYHLYCDGNLLTELDTYNLRSLTELSCDGNLLSKLSLHYCSSLMILSCADNILTSLDVTREYHLMTLNCSGNALTELDLTGCTVLKTFDGRNQKVAATPAEAVQLGGAVVVNLNTTELPWSTEELIFDALGGSYAQCGEGESSLWVYVPVTGSAYFLSAAIPFEMVGCAGLKNPDYILMAVGETMSLAENGLCDWVALDLSFEGDACVSFAEGAITANAPGTGRVVVTWALPGPDAAAISYAESFRLDITDPEDSFFKITGVSLSENKKTVELFKKDYAELDLLLEMDSLLDQVSLFSTQSSCEALPESTAHSVKNVVFDNDEVAALFSLVMDGDRSVRIVPTENAVNNALADKKNIQSSYTAPIRVELEYNGTTQTFVTEPLLLKIKQTRPSLKARQVTLNTHVSGEYDMPAVALSYSGGIINGAPDEAEVSHPEGLHWEYGENTIHFRYDGVSDIKMTANLTLDCPVEGWRITAPLTFKLKLEPVTPQLTFSKKSISITAGVKYDTAFTYTISKTMEAMYGDCYVPAVVSVTDRSGNVYDPTSSEIPLQVALDPVEKKIFVSAWNDSSNVACTYTVKVVYVDKEFTFKVKTKPLKAPSVRYSASGTIDVGSYGYADSITITPIVAGVEKIDGAYPGEFFISYVEAEFTKLQANVPNAVTHNRLNCTLSAMDSSGKLHLEYSGNISSIPTKSQLHDRGQRASYSTRLAYVFAVGETPALENMVNTNSAVKQKSDLKTGEKQYYVIGPVVHISLKHSEKLEPSVKLKVSGKLNPLLTDSVAAITPTFKNLSYSVLYDQELVCWKKVNKEWIILDELGEDNPFSCYGTLSGADYGGGAAAGLGYAYEGDLKWIYSVGIADPSALSGTYGISLRVKDGSKVICESAISTLAIVKNKPKITASRTTGDLLLKDCFDRTDVITLNLDDNYRGIREVCLDGASAQWFQLIPISETEYAIGWKDNKLPVGWKNGTTKTVTLNICLEGSQTVKANASVKVKITARSLPSAPTQ